MTARRLGARGAFPLPLPLVPVLAVAVIMFEVTYSAAAQPQGGRGGAAAPSQCTAQRGCESCRAAGCAWCIGSGRCVEDAVGAVGLCAGPKDHVGLASSQWICPTAAVPGTPAAGPATECLLLAKFGGFERPLYQAAARVATGGTLQLQLRSKPGGGGAWARRWCRIVAAEGRDGAPQLQCASAPPNTKPWPGASVEVRLGKCQALGSSKVRGPAGGALQL